MGRLPHRAVEKPDGVKFFNTRTRRIEPLSPIDPPNVRMYCSGSTVYNYAHIGNLRTYLFEDVLRRTLELREAREITTTRRETIDRIRSQFRQHLGDDLHLPEALAFAWSIARDANVAPNEKLEAFSYFDAVFGLDLDVGNEASLTDAQMSLSVLHRQFGDLPSTRKFPMA
jgi:cysteinyl-tRNA synthetase